MLRDLSFSIRTDFRDQAVSIPALNWGRVPGSNLAKKPPILSDIFRGFHQSVQANTRTMP